jgi:hypothetical protein
MIVAFRSVEKQSRATPFLPSPRRGERVARNEPGEGPHRNVAITLRVMEARPRVRIRRWSLWHKREPATRPQPDAPARDARPRRIAGVWVNGRATRNTPNGRRCAPDRDPGLRGGLGRPASPPPARTRPARRSRMAGPVAASTVCFATVPHQSVRPRRPPAVPPRCSRIKKAVLVTHDGRTLRRALPANVSSCCEKSSQAEVSYTAPKIN